MTDSGTAVRPVALLLAVSVVFAVMFGYCRGTSPFLAAEADQESARRVAARHGLTVGEVLALRDGVGVSLPGLAGDERAARFAQELARWKSKALAILALCGEDRLVSDLVERAHGDVARAEAALGGLPQNVQVVRFLSVAERLDRRLLR